METHESMTPPRSVEEWAEFLVDEVFGLQPLGMRGSEQEREVIMALRAYAAEQVAQARAEEREACSQIAFRYECGCPEGMLCGHRVAAGRIATALRART